MTTPIALNRPEPPRDRHGRYLIDGRPWQRVTTFAGLIDDASAVTKWKQRITAIGLAHRPDLITEIASLPADDRKRLDDACERAMEHGGGNSAATTGTALHRILERVDAEDPTLTIPEQLKGDVDAYLEAMGRQDIVRPTPWIERIGTHAGYGVAGTMDRIVYLGPDRRMVADIKTGASLDYAALKIAVQLHCYATFDRLWCPIDGDLPMPAVDQDTALVFHLPAGTARCDVIAVDLRPARRWAELCAEVRDARRTSKRKGVVFTPYTPTAEPETIRDLAVRLRGVTPRPAPTPTPTVDIDTLLTRRKELPPDALAQFDRWLREANADGTNTLNPRLRPAAAPTVDALLTLAEICDGDEPAARAAFNAAGRPPHPTIGAAAAAYTPTDAANLVDIITTWALAYQLDGTPTWEPTKDTPND